MNIQLLQGAFNAQEALELIAQMIQIKVKYHEQKIATDTSEEDIKYRESKIKRLQMELAQFRQAVAVDNQKLKLEATINIE